MSFVNGLLKFYAYVFHLALSTFLIGIAILAQVSNQPLHMEMVPFDQERMISRVSLLSLIGFICIFLALVQDFRVCVSLVEFGGRGDDGLGILFCVVFISWNRRIGVGGVADFGSPLGVLRIGLGFATETPQPLVRQSVDSTGLRRGILWPSRMTALVVQALSPAFQSFWPSHL